MVAKVDIWPDLGEYPLLFLERTNGRILWVRMR